MAVLAAHAASQQHRGTAAVLLCLALWACSERDAARVHPAVQEVSQERATEQQRAWAAIAAGALLVDVRTPREYARMHLPEAVNIPHDALGARLASVEPDTTRTIVLYCASGLRSAVAAAELRRAGYSRVIDGGGLRAMQAARPLTP